MQFSGAARFSGTAGSGPGLGSRSTPRAAPHGRDADDPTVLDLARLEGGTVALDRRGRRRARVVSPPQRGRAGERPQVGGGLGDAASLLGRTERGQGRAQQHDDRHEAEHEHGARTALVLGPRHAHGSTHATASPVARSGPRASQPPATGRVTSTRTHSPS